MLNNGITVVLLHTAALTSGYPFYVATVLKTKLFLVCNFPSLAATPLIRPDFLFLNHGCIREGPLYTYIQWSPSDKATLREWEIWPYEGGGRL